MVNSLHRWEDVELIPLRTVLVILAELAEDVFQLCFVHVFSKALDVGVTLTLGANLETGDYLSLALLMEFKVLS